MSEQLEVGGNDLRQIQAVVQLGSGNSINPTSPSSPTNPPPPPPAPTHAILLFDRMYMSSHQNVKFWATMGHTFHFFKAFLLLSFFITFYRNNFRDPFYQGTLTITLCSFALGYAHYKLQKLCWDFQHCIRTADYLEHAVRIQVEDNETGTDFNNSVSPIYNAMNPEGVYTVEQAASQEKKLSEQIRNCYLARSKPANICMNLGTLVSLCMVWHFIILMTETDPLPFQKGVLITYIVFQLLIKIQYVAYMLICLFIPIICLVMCLYSLIKRPKTARDYISTLTVSDYNPETLTDTQCTICYETFKEGDKIISLSCNYHHTFHEMCIKDWLRIGATCPLCRYDLTQEERS